ncbi:hypothetical protein Emed_001745 [Eimeria media]
MNAAAAEALRAAARCLPEATWRLRLISRQRLHSAPDSFAALATAGSRSSSNSSNSKSSSYCSSSSSYSSSSSKSSSKSSSRSSSGELRGGGRIHLWCSLDVSRIPHKAYPLQGLCTRGPLGGAPSFVWLSVRSFSGPLPTAATHATSITKKQQQQRQSYKQEQQQQQQQVAAAGRCDLPLAYPDDYASNAAPSTTNETQSSSSSNSSSNSSSSSSGSSSSSSGWVVVEMMEMLPLWARRLRPPKREIIFLRILPVAPLVLMALGLHALPRELII